MKRRSKVSSKPAKAQGRNAAKPKRRTTRHEPTVAPAAGKRGESPGTIRELNEAREQLQAISEVLRALGSSQGQLEPIFQSMLKNATRLCEAKFGALYLRETGGLRVSVMHGATAGLRRRTTTKSGNSATARNDVGRRACNDACSSDRRLED